jgi:hypothetical protein
VCSHSSRCAFCGKFASLFHRTSIIVLRFAVLERASSSQVQRPCALSCVLACVFLRQPFFQPSKGHSRTFLSRLIRLSALWVLSAENSQQQFGAPARAERGENIKCICNNLTRPLMHNILYSLFAWLLEHQGKRNEAPAWDMIKSRLSRRYFLKCWKAFSSRRWLELGNDANFIILYSEIIKYTAGVSPKEQAQECVSAHASRMFCEVENLFYWL